MAALMCGRALSKKLRDFSKILACQSQQLCHCREKHYKVIQNKHYKSSFVVSTSFLQSFRQFCEKPSSAARTFDQSSHEDKTNEKETTEDKGADKWVKRKKYALYFLQVVVVAGAVCLVYGWGRPFEDAEGNPIEDEFTNSNVIYAYLRRTLKEITFQVEITKEPSRQKLLPDPLSYPYVQPPYTLVIELTNVLVNPEWTHKTGWRFKKRPGIEYFLRAVGPPMFEVVIFTKESGMMAEPIVSKIDPENFIMYRLYRDATRYQDREHIKDLNYLNRDLSRVIMIDWNKEAYKLNPDNGFQIKKWTGDMNDTAMGELAEFLRAIVASKVDDVRPVLKYYSQFDDPMAKFHENQRKLQEEQERLIQAKQTRDSQSLTGLWSKWKR